MFKAIGAVRDEVLKRAAGGEITLEIVTKVFTDITVLDHIVFVGYEAPAGNPILGQFTRWSQHPGVYAGAETTVEIRYANNLSEDWLRLVICKELCHALEDPEGSHDVSNSAITKLVESFALLSAGKAQDREDGPFVNELLAVVAAGEILLPVVLRRRMLAEAGGVLSAAAIKKIAEDYKIPYAYAVYAFNPSCIQMVEWLLEQQ
ncbi:MAG: hypothetical protein LCH62_01640 [Proteobacteria bacterium]|nr:hypothetical protein [Pseudomonadota bacterium]